jgi:hypothetical protein
MGKKVYHDSEKIIVCIAEGYQLGIDTDDDLIYFIKNRTGYELTKQQLNYHKDKFRDEGAKYTTWLQNFAQNQVIGTASAHLKVFEQIRNDMFLIYRKKAEKYKKHLEEDTEPEPLELTELLDVKREIESNMDHIEKRHLALLYILPVKVALDKKDNRVKLENSDGDTRNAILIADKEAEDLEEAEKRLIDLTEVHGEDNLVA